MTREAKIGLLVALAFLLVIGILLSDHVTTSLRTPNAALGDVQDSIQDSVSWPGGSAAAQTPPRLPDQEPTEPETLPFVYREEPQIAVGRGTIEDPQQQPAGDQLAGGPAGTPRDDPWTTDPSQPGEQQPPLAGANGMLAGRPDLLSEAQRHGQELVPANSGAGETPAAQAGSTSSMAGVKEYTIQPGDSLSKITAKFLGRYTPANAAIILSLNPKLKANPDRIIVGETCQVPASPEAAASLRPTAPARQDSAQAAEQKPAEKPVRSPAADKTYTVKKGDTLWSIAAKQLGSGVRHKDILKLNADQLGSADDLQPGMKLKLPA